MMCWAGGMNQWVSNEGKTLLQTPGLDFSLLVFFLWWLVVFKVKDGTPSNRRNRGKGKGASPPARSAPLHARNGFPNRTPQYGELKWGLKGCPGEYHCPELVLGRPPQLHLRLRRVTGPWPNPGKENPAWNVGFISPQPQSTERWARQA